MTLPAALLLADLVRQSLGAGIAPHPRVKPLNGDFNGDGKQDLAVAVDINRQLKTWLKQGIVIRDLETMQPMKLDNEQHFCFAVLVLESMQPSKKNLFYGCFTGWKLARRGKRDAIELGMESGDHLFLSSDGIRYHAGK